MIEMGEYYMATKIKRYKEVWSITIRNLLTKEHIDRKNITVNNYDEVKEFVEKLRSKFEQLGLDPDEIEVEVKLKKYVHS